MNELISVILNVYNGEKYIRKCLESIINQTYKNLEIIIVNDGSTDKTLEICESYTDSRIRIINQENMGLSLSRNVGIDNANGKYLFFVDVDDFVALDTIDYLYKLLKEYDVKISTCNFMYIFDYDFEVQNKEEKITIKDSKEMIREVLLGEGRSGTIWNKLFEKSVFDNVRFENRIVNDVVVIYKLYMEAPKIVYSNQIKYFYLRHKDSIEGQRKRERTIDMYKASVERYEYIKKVYPDFIENEIGLLRMIFNFYYRDYDKISDFFKEEKLKQTYDKYFSLNKILKGKCRKNDKVKFILFRISPKLSKDVIKLYLRIFKKKIA